MSEVLPRSEPVADASASIASMPSSICCGFHPAIAIYLKPSAISAEVNADVLATSRAFLLSASISSVVAPLMALTSAIPCSKLANAPNESLPMSTNLSVNGCRISSLSKVATAPIFSPHPEKDCPTLSEESSVSSSSSPRLFSCCSVSMISRCQASYCSCVISSLSRALLRLSCWSFNAFNFFFVLSICSPSKRCFCAINSVLLPSNFSSLLTSLRLLDVLSIFLLMFCRAFVNPVASAESWIDMPLIVFLDAISALLLY